MKIFGGMVFVVLVVSGLLLFGTGCMPDFLDDWLPNVKNNPVGRIITPTNTNSPSDGSNSQNDSEKLTDTYIVTFKGANNFKPQSAKELLDEFNKNHPQGITTHHYRTKIDKQELIGLICVETVTGKNKISNMINSNTKLILVSIKQATNKDLQEHYSLGQPGL